MQGDTSQQQTQQSNTNSQTPQNGNLLTPTKYQKVRKSQNQYALSTTPKDFIQQSFNTQNSSSNVSHQQAVNEKSQGQSTQAGSDSQHQHSDEAGQQMNSSLQQHSSGNSSGGGSQSMNATMDYTKPQKLLKEYHTQNISEDKRVKNYFKNQAGGD